MDQVVAFMLLVGCNADASSCTEIPVPAPIYSSVDECNGELSMELRFSGTADDRVFGACTAVDEALLEQSATIEWGVSRSGKLVVDIVAEEPAVAALDAGSGLTQLASR